MSNIIVGRFDRTEQAFRESSDRIHNREGAGSTGGGMGGDGGSFEPRIARLEASVADIEADIKELKGDVRELRTDIRDIRDRLTRIEIRVDHLPTKGFIVTSVVMTLAMMTALIIFQDRVQRLVREIPPMTTASPSSPTP